MKSMTYAAVICLLPVTAFAQSQLEQFEALAEGMSAAMIDMFVNEIESQGGDGSALRALDGMTPPWDDDMRAAGECILDAYTADTSSAEVDAMLERMDAMLPMLSTMTMTEMSEDEEMMSAMTPQGISDERMMEINTGCGMMELQIAASQESGFMEAMMTAGMTVPDNN